MKTITTKSTPLTTGLALTAFLLLGGCGADDSDGGENTVGGVPQVQADADEAASTDVPDPCTLLTGDQAGAVVGAPVRIGDPQTPDGGRGLECEFIGPKTGTIEVEQSIIVRTATDDGTRLGDPADIDGLDEAYVNEPLHVVTWHPAGLTVEVQIVAHDGSADSLGNIETLAGQVDDALG
jgi:hypothetical protein